MASPSELIPQRYEVIRLKDSTELVGMTKDMGDYLEITLPMICQLSLIPGIAKTSAIFYPYSPLSSDERVKLPKTEVVHRNTMNPQFIPYYDNASARWFEMIENQSVPLASADETKRRDEMTKQVQEMIASYREEMSLEEELEDWDEDDYTTKTIH